MFPQASASMPICNNIISAHIKVHRNVRDKDINKNINMLKNKSSNVIIINKTMLHYTISSFSVYCICC